MKTTRTWRVYGTFKNFAEINYDFSEGDNTRVIEAKLVNDYIEVKITRNTAEECERELDGQLSDGIFENIRYTKVEEVCLSEQELKAIKKAIDNCNFDIDNAEEYYNGGTVTIHTGRNNRKYAWFLFDERNESAVDVETLEELTAEEIEELLA